MGSESIAINGVAVPPDTTLEVADMSTAARVKAGVPQWTDDLTNVPEDVEWAVQSWCEGRWDAFTDEDGEHEAGELWAGVLMRREKDAMVNPPKDKWRSAGMRLPSFGSREELVAAAAEVRDEILAAEALHVSTRRFDLI